MPPRKTPSIEGAGPPDARPRVDEARPLPRIDTSSVITHNEVSLRIEQGGCLRGVLLEAQGGDPRPDYAIFLLSSWRREYTVLGFNSAERPRLFRDVDRVLALVRFEYGFKGTIALRLASDGPPRRHSWRISHGTDFSRATIRKETS